MVVILLYVNIVFVRYQTMPGAHYTEWAVLSWRMYSRSAGWEHSQGYTLCIWIIYPPPQL